jgi:malto-oligosyltrehalose synthase
MRLQLHKSFTFADARRLVPYLAGLGISHLYSSPILKASAGSLHGYDVVDPTRVNPELGGESGFRELVAALRAAGLNLIVDIVPNHMAVGGSGNGWWMDVLENGPESPFAHYFDIDWHPANPALQNKVLAPFLGRPYGEALAAGELRVERDQSGKPELRYFDAAYPINRRDHAEIDLLGSEAYNAAEEEGRFRLHRLLERQHYRLAWWRVAGDEINWRRFFDINGLAGLRIELDDVFEATHATLFRLYAEGLIDGMRVDHVDGLSDPPGYCRRLRSRLDELTLQRPSDAPRLRPYLVVEKILGAGESLPDDWGVDGTSGYDFMDEVSAVQHAPSGEVPLAALWHSISGRPAQFAAEETGARYEILEAAFSAQLESTAASLHACAEQNPASRDTTLPAVRRALIHLLAHFHIYRTYGAAAGSSDSGTAFAEAVDSARHVAPGCASVLDLINELLTDGSGGLHRRAMTKFQQLSAPLAAKAVEDTAFYRYGRLLSRNDVGFDAAQLATKPCDFHAANQERRASFPDAMLATATHDHKRGEDVRARIAVLSEIPNEWGAAVRRWMGENAKYRRIGHGPMPSPGDEAMLYQMIAGSWPLDLSAQDRRGVHSFVERLAAWQQKALREAKLHTSWAEPNAAYEEASAAFLTASMADGSSFLPDAASFARRIGPAGAINGLAQTLLKLTSPGVPDFFQGTEFWDLSMVDPDNRRAIDFASRQNALREPSPLREMMHNWRSGQIKQHVIRCGLHLRRKLPSLFARGGYRPLPVSGPCADHVIAFLRALDQQIAVTVVPRLTCRLLDGSDSILIPGEAWQGTHIHLPSSLPGASLRNVINEATIKAEPAGLGLNQILSDLPIALLTNADEPQAR